MQLKKSKESLLKSEGVDNYRAQFSLSMVNRFKILEWLKFDIKKKPFYKGEDMAALEQTIWSRYSVVSAADLERHLLFMTGVIDPVLVQGHGLSDLLRALSTTCFCDCMTAFKICARWGFSICCILLPLRLSKWKIAHSGTGLFQMKLSARKLSAVRKPLCTCILQDISWAARIPFLNPQKIWKLLIEDSHNLIKIRCSSYPQCFPSILRSVKPE